jgi:hypothetical protein
MGLRNFPTPSDRSKALPLSIDKCSESPGFFGEWCGRWNVAWASCIYFQDLPLQGLYQMSSPRLLTAMTKAIKLNQPLDASRGRDTVRTRRTRQKSSLDSEHFLTGPPPKKMRKALHTKSSRPREA